LLLLLLLLLLLPAFFTHICLAEDWWHIEALVAREWVGVFYEGTGVLRLDKC